MLPPHQYEQIALYKIQERLNDDEVAALIGVSRRTLQRYLHHTEYANAVKKFREQRKEEIRGRITSIADDVITSLHNTAMNDKNGLARAKAAEILGRWIGLDQLETEVPEDNQEEFKELLRIVASRPVIIELPPPSPGGVLPPAYQSQHGKMLEAEWQSGVGRRDPAERRGEKEEEPQETIEGSFATIESTSSQEERLEPCLVPTLSRDT